jgi:predicted phage terminase large subunit-like protein
MIRTKHTVIKTRTRKPRKKRFQNALGYPAAIFRELNDRSFFHFFKYFWEELSTDDLILNWHIEYLCNELQELAETIAEKKQYPYDYLLINIPPGTSKTSIVSKAFPVWCWTRWYWMRFITGSYGASLALESAEGSRDLVRSEKFKATYPEISIKQDKDTKSNFRVVKTFVENKGHTVQIKNGGNRLSTSVGGAVTGFHGHILIVDDPLDPRRSHSKVELDKTNRWFSESLSTRKIDKKNTPVILIMQRLHQNDPTGFLIKKRGDAIKHICLPGTLEEGYKKQVKPKHLINKYQDGLLDPFRLDKETLKKLQEDLGQYGFHGQIGQNPTPPGGGMFKVDNFVMIEKLPSDYNFVTTVRYWDKAGSDGMGAYTVGAKLSILRNKKIIVQDIVRGQWSSEQRERIIRRTAEADGTDVFIYMEQEPGSGGKESAEASIRNLIGFSTYKDRPQGDKAFRADPFSVQVNEGNVMLLKGEWNQEFIEEYRFFPFSTYKDQVDAGSGAFNKLVGKKSVRAF